MTALATVLVPALSTTVACHYLPTRVEPPLHCGGIRAAPTPLTYPNSCSACLRCRTGLLCFEHMFATAGAVRTTRAVATTCNVTQEDGSA